jgi:hypothetical protein
MLPRSPLAARTRDAGPTAGSLGEHSFRGFLFVSVDFVRGFDACPLYPQKRTLEVSCEMSALCHLMYAEDNGWLEVTPTTRDMQPRDTRTLTAAGFAQI